MKKFILFIILFSAISSFAQTIENFDIQGHRGARGLVPENTVPSFIKALEYGVDTLELDVVISKDKKVVVSHEPWFSHIISLNKNGKPISEAEEKQHNIYRMDYREIKLYDVGSIGNKNFPEQQKMRVHKPLLSDVFKAVEKYVKQKKLKPIRYNIEIKSTAETDDVFHPVPSEFARLVYEEILLYKLENRTIIQSFDVRPLQELRKMLVKLPLAFLVSDKDGIEANLARLGFVPDVFSPHFSLVDEALVRFAGERNLPVIPWTINEIADMERMKKFNLAGIITDYPDRAVKVFGRTKP